MKLVKEIVGEILQKSLVFLIKSWRRLETTRFLFGATCGNLIIKRGLIC